jgi:hypothetical protein
VIDWSWVDFSPHDNDNTISDLIVPAANSEDEMSSYSYRDQQNLA